MFALLGHNHGIQDAIGFFQDIGPRIRNVEKNHRFGDMGIILERRQLFRRLAQQLLHGLGGERAECGQKQKRNSEAAALSMNKTPI